MGWELSEFSKFGESDKSQEHHFKDPVCYLCLGGAVETFWYPTQEVASSSNSLNQIFLTLNSVKNILDKIQCKVLSGRI